jgi:hypothetical protein
MRFHNSIVERNTLTFFYFLILFEFIILSYYYLIFFPLACDFLLGNYMRGEKLCAGTEDSGGLKVRHLEPCWFSLLR